MPQTESDLKEAMAGDIKNVRNVVVMGPLGAGKTCALDCLYASKTVGLVPEAKIGQVRFASVRKDEQAKGSTIKSGLNSMVVDGTLLHALDVPGHTEYVPELAVMGPLADGAMFCVDASKSEIPPTVGMQLKICNDFKHTAVLFCNRLDTPFMATSKKPHEEIYDDCKGIVQGFNDLLSVKDRLKDQTIKAEAGQVLFGSLANGWAFSIRSWAELYSKGKGTPDVDGMALKLWTKYFNREKKSWTGAPAEGYTPGFVELILKPIQGIYDLCAGDENKDNKTALKKKLGQLKVDFVAAEIDNEDMKDMKLFHHAMRAWMPAGPAIMACLKEHIPDPQQAQAKRFSRLVDAPDDDTTSLAVKACDPKGRLLFGIAKMVPQPNAAGRFLALGRVYSGQAKATTCQLMEEGWVPKRVEEALAKAAAEAVPVEASSAGAEGEDAPDGSESPGVAAETPKDTKAAVAKCQEKRVQGVLAGWSKTVFGVSSVPAGNICYIQGIDQFLVKRGSLADKVDDWAMRKPTIDQSPVIRVSLGPKAQADLPKMVEGLKRLVKSCPIVETALEDNGKHVMAACGEEHMRVLKGDLETEYCTVELQWEQPSITYRETITMESSTICLAKSPNKHNRLFIKAEPLSEELNLAIEANLINPNQDVKIRSKKLEKEFGWGKTDTLKIWGFGPAPETAGGSYGANLLVDQTKAIQYLNEIRESVNSGLLWAARQGPLCEENMRGIRFNLLDVKMHADSIHRGMGQIQPTARRVFFASSMTAGIRFQEPIFLCTIAAPTEVQPGIMQALGACRGEFQMHDEANGVFLATVPIAETIGKTPFATVLQQKTNGKAVPNYAFDHWEVINADPMSNKKDKMGVYNPTSRAAEILLEVRKRKGLKVEFPDLTEYLDKL